MTARRVAPNGDLLMLLRGIGVCCSVAKLQVGVTLAAWLLAAGCFGDPPPDPDVAPIEVVAESRQRADEPCLLNRNEIGAGTHEVVAITEGGAVTVRIRDSAGAVLVELKTTESPAGSEVTLGTGAHAVECMFDDGSIASVPLRVVPPS